MSSIRDKARQIFEYLLAIKDLSSPVERDMSRYSPIWWEKDFPFVEGCFLYGSGRNEETWLEVHKQELASPPSPPQILQTWLNRDIKDPEKRPRYIHSKKQADREIYFEESDDRMAAWGKWIASWDKWSEAMLPKYRIQRLYGELFSLNQRFQREDEIIELVWGHGLFNWTHAGESINRHIFVTRMELVYRADQGIFEIIPTGKGTVLELDMLNGIDVPNIKRLIALGKRVQEEDINPLDTGILKALCEEFINILSPTGSVRFGNESKQSNYSSSEPVIHDTSALFIRNKAMRQWHLELNGIIEAIDNGYPIPPLIGALTTEEDLNNILPPDFVQQTKEEWKSLGEEIFFPLVSNHEQKEIIKRLVNSYGVSVQGPPGTGKSHTIANLICHLLAHGKRVLVTSHTERALRVLSDKIPDNVRPLCVSVTGGDSSSIKEIENSIRSISENLALDPDNLRKELRELNSDLSQVRNTLAELYYKLKQAAIRENTKIDFNGREQLPGEVAQWINDNEEHGWMPDSITISAKMPDEQVVWDFYCLAAELNAADLEALDEDRPDLKEILSPSAFKEMISTWKDERTKFDKSRDYISGWKNTHELHNNIDAYISLTDYSIGKLEQFQNSWAMEILDDISKGGQRKETWKSLFDDCQSGISSLLNLNRQLAAFNIRIPNNVPLVQLKEDLKEIKNHLSQNKSLGWMYMKITGRKQRYVFEGSTINEACIKTLDDIALLETYVERSLQEQALANSWNAYISEINGELLEIGQKRLAEVLDDNLGIIRTALAWEDEVVLPLNPVMKTLGIEDKTVWTDRKWFKELNTGFEAIAQEKKFHIINLQIEEIQKMLESGAVRNNAHNSWSDLLQALNGRDAVKWESIINELQRLARLETVKDKFYRLKAILEENAPSWVNQIIISGRRQPGLDFQPPQDWKTAWQWSQANDWFKKFEEETNIDIIQQDITINEKLESRLIAEIVAKSSWLHQIENTTPAQRRSLHAWMQTIKKIGKGTGKYADKHRRDAKVEMENCQDAIPVWVMPLHRVIENLKITNKPFDVVIVDESSQSDIFTLSAFFRAKKAIVVGDDKQISPESVGSNQSQINELIVRYLAGIPQKERLDMQTSIYDIALRIFPGNLMLKEHFRCVPEIIQFSNDQFYGGQIEPLRLPKSFEILEPPIRTIRVAQGRREVSTAAINYPEADALVKQIEACCSDKLYEGKTMGVISLQGFDQARVIQEMLRERIGDMEIINRRIICGDAYSFQGDERDVMFLSMVAASNMRIGALAKQSDEKRFNVAASRAKDQTWLFHSVDLDDLNPNCMRAKLLGYYLDPGRVVREENEYDSLFESKFEKDVFKLISARGYSVRPQVKVGRYNKRIDMVVEGMRNRLAVECDGDTWHGPDRWEQDMERQRLLERIGWVFWRVMASTFYRNPEKAMQSLWVQLDEMGIEPTKLSLKQSKV